MSIITVPLSSLSRALKLVSKAVPSRASITVLESIHCSIDTNRLTLTGFDLDNGIQTTIPVDYSGDPAIFLLNAALFSAAIDSLKGDALKIEIQDSRIKIECGSSKLNLNTSIGTDDYPTECFDADSTEIALSIDRAFIDAMVSVQYTASVDETKAILCGVNIANKADGLVKFAATDGHRLAINSWRSGVEVGTVSPKDGEPEDPPNEEEAAKDDSINLKSKGIKLLSGYDFSDSILLTAKDGTTIVKDDTTTFLIRQIDGRYPQYDLLLPQSFEHEIAIDRRQLIDAIEIAKLVSGESFLVKLTFSSSTLTVSSEDEKANCSTQIESSFVSKEDLEIAFNHKYLSAALKAASGDKVVMNINGALQPVIIKSPDRPDYIHMVMPVQIRE